MAKSEAIDVSIIQLIAAPAQYNEKYVRVVGFLNLEYQKDAIYLHKEDLFRGITRNGLWVIANKKMYRGQEKYSRQYVVLEGTFRVANKGHNNLWSGAIENIEHIEVLAPIPE